MVSAISSFKAQNVAVPSPVYDMSQKAEGSCGQESSDSEPHRYRGAGFLLWVLSDHGLLWLERRNASFIIFETFSSPGTQRTGRCCLMERQFTGGHVARASRTCAE